MGRSRKNITEKKRSRWIANGSGQGAGETYIPFHHARDVPSVGFAHQLPSLRHKKRVHHYLSRLEATTHSVFERNLPLDIREQFALLPVERTQAIAASLGVPHPKYPGTNVDIVVTTDIVVTNNDGSLTAAYVKPAKHMALEHEDGQRNQRKVPDRGRILESRSKRHLPDR